MQLHNETLQHLEALAKCHHHDNNNDALEALLLQALSTKTNTPAAGDVMPARSLL
jgi:hypothetical protein